MIHPETATEREMFMSSPLRMIDPIKRTNKKTTIGNSKMFAGGHRGNFLQEGESPITSEDEEADNEEINDMNIYKNNPKILFQQRISKKLIWKICENSELAIMGKAEEMLEEKPEL